MKLRSISVLNLFTCAIFAPLMFSAFAAAQTSEPDEQIRREMIAYARKVENTFDSSRPRDVAEHNSSEKIRSESASRENSGTESKASKSVVASLERQAFDLLNVQRITQSLQPLRWSEDMARVARLHSENMTHYKFFSHMGIDGKLVSHRADQLGISDWRSIGENIVYNRGFKKPVESACQQWMNSPAHRENLLNPKWLEAGIGAAIAPDGTYYFTQVFILR